MLPRIDAIKQQRLKTGATQKKLADMTGVSTSMINQIESGRTKPSYDTARKIFDALAKLEDSADPHRAGDFCSKDMIILNPGHTLHEAIEKMDEHSISQIPIFEDDRVVGVITEDGIVKRITDAGEHSLKSTRLGDAMEPAPPIVDYNTPARALVPLIRYSKCIIDLMHNRRSRI